ncbi:MAG: TIGR02281 family clan AA aspartic protease [Paracoccaceae bacterium]
MNVNDWVEVTYLVILASAIAAGAILQFRKDLNKTLQQALLWGLLFFGVVILYGFRDTLRLQLTPHRAIETADGKIVIARAADRHFYTTVNIDGTDILFVIDTGASGIVLSRPDAERLGIDTERLSYAFSASTANGRVRTARVTLGRVILAGVSDHDVRAWVNDGEMDGSLLGMSYLSLFSHMEISGDTLTLTR